MKRWRDLASPIIAAVIARVGTSDMKSLRKALREAYPFGEYKYHPCKIWRDEINVQLGKKKAYEPKVKLPATSKPISGQKSLFGEQRICPICGEPLGVIENYSREDTCGSRECDREMRDSLGEVREMAHEDLDRQLGW